MLPIIAFAEIKGPAFSSVVSPVASGPNNNRIESLAAFRTMFSGQNGSIGRRKEAQLSRRGFGSRRRQAHLKEAADGLEREVVEVEVWAAGMASQVLSPLPM